MKAALLKKLVLVVLLTFYSGPLMAATIDFQSTVTATDGTGPIIVCIPGSGFGPCQEAGGNFRPDAQPFFAFNNLDNGSGTSTAINSFSSLSGVAPADLTFTFGDLELINFIGTTASGTEVYGEGDASPLFFNMFKSGTLIATGTDMVMNVVTDRDIASPTFGQATGFGTVRLTGLTGDPFYEEVLTLTGGTGILQITLGSFAPTTFSDPEIFQITGTLTAVPEPASLLLLGSGLAGLGAWRRLKGREV